MTFTVSISQFRSNIATYLEKALRGDTVLIRDEKKDRTVAQLSKSHYSDFDPEAFGKALKTATGVFTAESHPEWKTKKDVIKWVAKERKASDRTF